MKIDFCPNLHRYHYQQFIRIIIDNNGTFLYTAKICTYFSHFPKVGGGFIIHVQSHDWYNRKCHKSFHLP